MKLYVLCWGSSVWYGLRVAAAKTVQSRSPSDCRRRRRRPSVKKCLKFKVSHFTVTSSFRHHIPRKNNHPTQNNNNNNNYYYYYYYCIVVIDAFRFYHSKMGVSGMTDQIGFSFPRNLQNAAAESSNTAGDEITLVFLLLILIMTVVFSRYVCNTR